MNNEIKIDNKIQKVFTKFGFYGIVAVFIILATITIILASPNMTNSIFRGYQNSPTYLNSTENSQTQSEKNGVYKTIPFEKLELADSLEEREKGMMYRKSICETCGILFVFERPQRGAFWMKNTYVPLDIIFVNSEGRIVKIHKNTTPLQTDPDYSPEGEYLYTLEFLGGYSEKYYLKEGDTLNMPEIIKKTVEFDNSFGE